MVAVMLFALFGTVLGPAGETQEPRTTDQPALSVAFEDDQVRVLHVVLDPGESTEIRGSPGGVLVYLTADLDGRIPAAEAAWQPEGTTTLSNRARTRFEGILVELPAPKSPTPSALPPEATWKYESLDQVGYLGLHRAERPRVATVIDNPRVLVTRHRVVPWVRTERFHMHRREVVLVYLAGGTIRGSTGGPGVRRVRRGEFDVLPANLLHAFRNEGNDPMDFVMIAPK